MNIITTKENRSIAAKLWDKKDISWMARKNRFKEVKGAKIVDWKLDSISVNEEDFYLLVQEDLNIYIAFVKELAEFTFQILTRELDQIYAIPQEQIKLYKKALFNGDVMKIKTRKNVKIKLSELEIDDINYCLESYDVRLPDKEKIMYCIELSNVLSIKSQFGKNKLNDNNVYHIKLGRAKKKYSYVTLDCNFEHFEKWDKYTGLSKNDEKYKDIRKEIIGNNNNMIEQYLEFIKSEESFPTMLPLDQQRDILGAYLNEYLLKDKIQTIITNAAEIYTYKVDDEIGIAEYIVTMTELFNFLQKTGVIKKSDNEKVRNLLEELAEVTRDDDDDYSIEDELLNALSSLSNEELDLLREIIDSVENHVDSEVIPDSNRDSEVPYMKLLRNNKLD